MFQLNRFIITSFSVSISAISHLCRFVVARSFVGFRIVFVVVLCFAISFLSQHKWMASADFFVCLALCHVLVQFYSALFHFKFVCIAHISFFAVSLSFDFRFWIRLHCCLYACLHTFSFPLTLNRRLSFFVPSSFGSFLVFLAVARMSVYALMFSHKGQKVLCLCLYIFEHFYAFSRISFFVRICYCGRCYLKMSNR